ncbi:MAG: right-handed parallel beta-helix repeat-containing protein [Treponema sp.]|nr:right-handed parallel beta-helix repeat-containing protein [Treponema sp.]
MTRKNLLHMMVILTLLAACAGSPGSTGADRLDRNRQSYYVSAAGSDSNNGKSATRPFKTLTKAINAAYEGDINTITVIGTLTHISEEGEGFFLNFKNSDREIFITGRLNAPENQRAILTVNGLMPGVIEITNGKFRFEHIAITGGMLGGLLAHENAQVTLGPGSIVHDNTGFGVLVADESSVIIDGGEIRSNGRTGIDVLENGSLIMNSGVISENRHIHAGGVYVHTGGVFVMSGGIITGNNADGLGGGIAVDVGGTFILKDGLITGNNAEEGGGVFIRDGGIFEQTGGTIDGNTARYGPDLIEMF